MVVSATGVRHTVTLEHMRAMHEGAALAVIGGIANEIALDEVSDFTPQVNRDTVQLNVPDGPTLTLIAPAPPSLFLLLMSINLKRSMIPGGTIPVMRSFVGCLRLFMTTFAAVITFFATVAMNLLLFLLKRHKPIRYVLRSVFAVASRKQK